MEKKLPKVFANKIDKILTNNKKVYVSNKNVEEDETIKKQNDQQNNKKIISNQPEKTINQKIKQILNDKTYAYKIPVIIETNEQKFDTKIIGKNKTNIITIDNQIIKISEIRDIKIKQKNE